jgi:hypothetical protein
MNRAVTTVRNGVLNDYNTTTVGKAFEGTFQDAKWSSFVTDKGVTVVQFDGTIVFNVLHDASDGMNLFEAASKECLTSVGLGDPSVRLDLNKLVRMEDAFNKLSKCMNGQPVPVRFQFSLSEDKKAFKITHMNVVNVYKAFDTQADALSFIYR